MADAGPSANVLALGAGLDPIAARPESDGIVAELAAALVAAAVAGPGDSETLADADPKTVACGVGLGVGRGVGGFVGRGVGVTAGVAVAMFLGVHDGILKLPLQSALM